MKTAFFVISICLGFLGYGSSNAMGMSEMDTEKASVPAVAAPQHINFGQVLHYIEQGLPDIDIENITNKDLVVVLGRTQVGKSTTINAALGAKLTPSLDGEDIVMEEDLMERVEGAMGGPRKQKYAPMGGMGISKTMLPAMYYSPECPFIFLDTRGFYDIRFEHEQEIAASILMEVALKRARSVRVMFLEKYSALKEGAIGFRPLGKIISKIVSARAGQKVPILFAFNQFSPPLHPPVGYTLPTEQNLEDTNIPKSIDRIIEGETLIMSGVMERVAKKLKKSAAIITGMISEWRRYFSGQHKGQASILPGSEEIVQDEEVQNAFEEIRYINFLRYNKDQRRIAYISPLEPESIERFVQKLHDLPPILHSSLAFDNYNFERVEFNGLFAQKVENLLPFINLKKRVSEYSIPLLEELVREAIQCRDHHRGVLADFNPDRLTMDQKQKLENEYDTSMDDTRRQIDRQKVRQKTLTDENGILLKLNVADLSGEPAVYWHDIWNEECGFFKGWWRNHRVKYPHTTVPFKTWVDEGLLESGTYRNKILDEHSPRLELLYTSNIAHNCAGTVNVYVAPTDNPVTMATIRERARQIDTKDLEIKACDRTIENLSRAIDGGLREKIEAKHRIFEEQRGQLERAVRLRRDMDALYEGKRREVEACARIAELLESPEKKVDSILPQFLSSWRQFIGQKEKGDLPDFRDSIFELLLLDPMQVKCPSGGHGLALERHAIVRWLQQGGICPFDRAPVGGLTPVSPMAAKINDVINELFTTTTASEDEFRRLSSSH